METLKIRVFDTVKVRESKIVLSLVIGGLYFTHLSNAFEDELNDALVSRWVPAGARPPTFGVDYFCASSLQPA